MERHQGKVNRPGRDAPFHVKIQFLLPFNPVVVSKGGRLLVDNKDEIEEVTDGADKQLKIERGLEEIEE